MSKEVVDTRWPIGERQDESLANVLLHGLGSRSKKIVDYADLALTEFALRMKCLRVELRDLREVVEGYREREKAIIAAKEKAELERDGFKLRMLTAEQRGFERAADIASHIVLPGLPSDREKFVNSIRNGDARLRAAQEVTKDVSGGSSR
jgi:hypothetical protein